MKKKKKCICNETLPQFVPHSPLHAICSTSKESLMQKEKRSESKIRFRFFLQVQQQFDRGEKYICLSFSLFLSLSWRVTSSSYLRDVQAGEDVIFHYEESCTCQGKWSHTRHVDPLICLLLLVPSLIFVNSLHIILHSMYEDQVVNGSKK